MSSSTKQYSNTYSAALDNDIEQLQLMRANNKEWHAKTMDAASMNGNIELLDWLRTNGCPWSKTTTLPFHTNNLEVVKYAVTNQLFLHPMTVRMCIHKGYFDVVKYLIDNNAFPYDNLVSSIGSDAAGSGNIDFIAYCIEKNFTNNMMIGAIKAGHVHVVEYLLQHEFKINFDCINTCLDRRRFEILQFWLDNNQLQGELKDLLDECLGRCFSSSYDALVWLLDHNYNFNSNILEALVRCDRVDCINLLMSHRVVQFQNHGVNATVIAAKRGFYGCLKYLAEEQKCLINHRTVFAAAEKGYFKCMKYAFEKWQLTFDPVNLDRIKKMLPRIENIQQCGFTQCYQYLVKAFIDAIKQKFDDNTTLVCSEAIGD